MSNLKIKTAIIIMIISVSGSASFAEDNLNTACPTIAQKDSYYKDKAKLIAGMADEGIKKGNTPIEICKVLVEHIVFLSEIRADAQSCLPSVSLKLNDTITNLTAQLQIANQQRLGLGCR